MKRVNLSLRSINHPEQLYSGYAVVGELNNETLSFFCAEKLKVDEELQVTFSVGHETYSYPVALFNLHEQISSGRIMTSLPTEANPFPARKFYRCFARVLKAEDLRKRPEITPEQSIPASEDQDIPQAA